MVDLIKEVMSNGWGVVGVVMLISIFIQITPIKINPLSWVGKCILSGMKWIGRQVNGELYEKIQETQNQLEEHLKQADERFAREEKDKDEDKIGRLRWSILDFGYSVKTKTYRREAFDHVFEDYEKYKKLLSKYGMKNGQTDRAMKQITDVYNERMNDPEF